MFGDKTPLKKCPVYAMSGVPNFAPGALVDCKTDWEDRKLVFHQMLTKTGDVILPFEKISNVQVEMVKSVVGKKSGLSSALVGGALAGPAGALVGVVAGKGKEKTKIDLFMTIEYNSANGPVDIKLKMFDAISFRKFEKQLKESLGIVETDTTQEITL